MFPFDAQISLSSMIDAPGTIGYVSQESWIRNDTVRGNITFGLPYDEAVYQQCIFAAALTHDISILQDGDLTEIGERGINLSGQ